MQFVGIPSETLYWILLTVWPISGLVVFYPRTEELLARWFHRFRSPSALEMQRIGPAWWAVCTAAGVDPDRFRVWIYEGPEATAPIPAGNTVAVSSWSVYNLGGSRHLEAVLAHELAHHLALPRLVSPVVFWLSLPARAMGAAIMEALKTPVLSIVVKIVFAFFLFGVLLVWFFTGFSFYVIMMLLPLLAPIVIPWAARTEEKYADRVATDLGYGVLLVQIFSGRKAQRGLADERALRQGLSARQPNESARLRALEKYLNATAGTPPPPGTGYF